MFMPHRPSSKRSFFAVAATLLASLPFAAAQSATPTTPYTPAQIESMLDPQMKQVIDLFKTIMGTPIIDLTPQDARQQFSAQDAAKILARTSGAQEAPMPVGKVTDGIQIPAYEGNQIPIRIYTPAGAGPFPVVLYFHGGGFVIATIDTYDASPRALSDYANAIVVSVEYRKAPEAPFPAALRDAEAAYDWVTHEINHYNGIDTKIALAGESAGGNLATELAMYIRDNNLRRPTHELLVYPITTGDTNQASDIAYKNAIPLNTPMLTYFSSKYLPSPGFANDPQVSPINGNLKDLPPTTIIAAEIDPLRSDGVDYYNKLKTAGNQVSYQIYTGTTHEFFGMGAVVDKAKAAEQFGAARIAASFK